MTNIAEIEGIAAGYAAKLRDIGVSTTEVLLERGGSPRGREELADKTGISGKQILRWVNHADLFRISGVAGEYAELLEAAGVDSVAELAQRRAENLHEKLVETNTARKLVRQTPSLTQVSSWIGQAKELPRKVTH